MAVVKLTGGLGDDIHKAGEFPVSIRGEGLLRGIIHEGAFQQGSTVLTAVGDTVRQDGIRVDGFSHEAGDVLRSHG